MAFSNVSRTVCLVLLLSVVSVQAFTVPAKSASLMRMAAGSENQSESPKFVERGVSVDQDGKSNVWAIEPKMEISSKSSDETSRAALLAGGGLLATAVAAVVILTNLPDPNMY